MEMKDPLANECDNKLNTKMDLKELKETSIKEHNSIKELKEFIQEQNEGIYRLLREHKQLMMQLVTNKTVNPLLAGTSTLSTGKKKPEVTFPLRKEENLHEIELVLKNQEKHDFYITQISSLLNGNVRKYFKNVIAIDIVLQYNLDGTHGKKRFKQFTQLYDVVLAAIESCHPNAARSCETELRNAFAIMKNRHFKNVSISNKKKK